MADDLEQRVEKDNVKFLELQFSDMFGGLKAVTIPKRMLGRVLADGKWFDGSSIEGFARTAESDMLLKPDPQSYLVLPFENGDKCTARLVCDVYHPDGKIFEGYPRQILRRTIALAQSRGFAKYQVSPELEFFLFDKGVQPHDASGYLDAGTRDTANVLKREIMVLMEKAGINVEMAHHEVAPGQHEIGFEYDDALAIADNTLLFRQIVKLAAAQKGLHATFMPKPIKGVNGSGMHTHFSLANEAGTNLFYDATNAYGLSKTATSFIAGILKHASKMTLLLNPTVNSYKRLTPGYEAPVYVCWARCNRSALIRVPGGINEKSARAEIRSPDSSCSPHLAFAALLMAGLEGIEQGLEPPAPVEEDIYLCTAADLEQKGIDTLPDSLIHAIRKAERSDLVKKLLSEPMFSRYIGAKRQEWDDFRTSVTGWEMDRYFDRL